MLRYVRYLAAGISCVLLGVAASSIRAADEAVVQLNKGDRIAIIGNTLADRMQHHGWLETLIQSRFPQHELVFRNLGFAGDEIKTRPRSANFGSPEQWLTKAEADVIFCFFGYNEALRGEGAIGGFAKDLAGMIDGMRGQKFNGESAPQIVVFSPIAHEDLGSPHLSTVSRTTKSWNCTPKRWRLFAKTRVLRSSICSIPRSRSTRRRAGR